MKFSMTGQEKVILKCRRLPNRGLIHMKFSVRTRKGDLEIQATA